jgi:hypothetical protein
VDSEQRHFVNMVSAETSRVGGEPGEVDQHEASKRAEIARRVRN